MRRINEISTKVDLSSQAVLGEKVRNLETDYAFLHQWKNVGLPQQFERQSEAFVNLIKQVEGEMNRRINKLDAEAAMAYNSEELRRYLDHLRDDRVRMHEENSIRLTRIDNELIRVHSRIDEFLKK